MEKKYGHITNAPYDLPFLPFNEYGLYASEPFYLLAGEVVEIVVKSGDPIVIEKGDYDSRPSLQGKLWVLISYRYNRGDNNRTIDSNCFSASDNLRRVNDHWENSTVFTPDEDDHYVLLAVTQYGGAGKCSYAITQRS